jgi:hypothetical protein
LIRASAPRVRGWQGLGRSGSTPALDDRRTA